MYILNYFESCLSTNHYPASKVYLKRLRKTIIINSISDKSQFGPTCHTRISYNIQTIT